MNNCFFLKGHLIHQFMNADVHPSDDGLLTLSLLVTQDDFTDILIRLHFLMTVRPERYPLGGLLSPPLFSQVDSFYRQLPWSRRDLSCVTGVTSNSQTSSKWYTNTAWTAECFCLYVAWCTWRAPWWHLRKHTWGPSGSEKPLSILGRLLSLWSAWACSLSHFLAFFPQKVRSLNPAVFQYGSCGLLKHGGSMTNEVEVELTKIISLFLTQVAISILVPQALPILRARGVFWVLPCSWTLLLTKVWNMHIHSTWDIWPMAYVTPWHMLGRF